MAQEQPAEGVRVARGGLADQLRVGRVVGGCERLRPGAPAVAAARLVVFRRRSPPVVAAGARVQPVPFTMTL